MVGDPYLWLEELDSAPAMDWVRERNAETVAELATADRFSRLRSEFQRILDSEDRIPLASWHGPHVYNLWRDAKHPRGLWRRTTLTEYRRPHPEWEVLLDVDALGAAEGENWVWQDVELLRPDGRRCLISLSRGGADACVVREFDLDAKAFVPDGFTVPEAKTDVCWIDADRIYVGTDFGTGSLTSSGYPRIVKEWHRGTPIDAATTVFEGSLEDVAVTATHYPTPGFECTLVRRHLDFFHSQQFVRTAGGELSRLDVPDDAVLDLHREWLLIRLRSAWLGHPAGSLLAVQLADFPATPPTVLFEPDERTFASYHTWTRDNLILRLLVDVQSRLEILTPTPAGWERTRLTADLGHTDVLDTNRDHSDEYLLLSNDFVQPSTLRYGTVGGELETLKQEPEFFDAYGMSVRQHFATSLDGTRVPYFVVGRDGASGPTLLSGYGGFEVSRTPAYSGILGRGWLARGGTYVVANIRGGGEYGPGWHQAALREHRHRAYEDFAAVATDLVERGIAQRNRLGIEGGSNGGLLMGVMLTRYPELFSAVVCQVPLADMRRYHLLLAGASWMAEYGNPDDEADWAFLKEYSPYHNVHSGRPYPPALLLTSTRDDRVHPAHARKMVALLRSHGYDVHYYENIEGGHGGAADNAQLAFKWALAFEFLWRTLAP
jgi:prolyl oligopeptidase